MGLDPYYVERFAAVRDVTWADVYRGDADAIERAMAFGRPAGDYHPPTLDIRNATAPGTHGPVPVRVYAPRDAPAGLPCLAWMHGGAFAFGDLDMLEAHAVSAEIAHRWPGIVVSVDYRLAPKHQYPIPLDDCVAVLEWVADRHQELAVGGASAGANLAVATALRLRDGGGPGLHAMCLAYPAPGRHVPEPTSEVAALLEQVPPLARFSGETREGIYRNYLGTAYDDPPPYAEPASADLTGLPPTAIANAEYDDLRLSGEAFAGVLRAHGVPVDEWVEPGTAHGYLNAVGVVAGATATLDRFVRHLRRHVGGAGAV